MPASAQGVLSREACCNLSRSCPLTCPAFSAAIGSYPPIVALTHADQGPVSARVFSQRSQ